MKNKIKTTFQTVFSFAKAHSIGTCMVALLITTVIVVFAACGSAPEKVPIENDGSSVVTSSLSSPGSDGEISSEKENVDGNASLEEITSSKPSTEEASKPTSTHKHSYTKKVVQPTCTKDGYTKYTCKCGKTYKDNVEYKLGHRYRDWKVVKEATTSKTGLKECTCERCGKATKTETIPKKKTLKGIDPRVEIGVAKYTTYPQYKLKDCWVTDKRTWGEPPAISVDDEDCMYVTYRNKDGKEIKFAAPQPDIDDTTNLFTIKDDGTYISQNIGSYS